MREAWEKGARIIVFPELGITGYTCSDLFRQDILGFTDMDREGMLIEGFHEKSTM